WESCRAAAKARAATERPEPGGPVISQACVIAAGLATEALSVATAWSCPTSALHTLIVPPGESSRPATGTTRPYQRLLRQAGVPPPARGSGTARPARAGKHPGRAGAAARLRLGPERPAGCAGGMMVRPAPGGPGPRRYGGASAAGPDPATRSGAEAALGWRTGRGPPPAERRSPGRRPGKPRKNPGSGR